VEVPSEEVPDVAARLTDIQSNSDNATVEFAELLQAALSSFVDNSTAVEATFQFLDLVYFEDASGVAALQQVLAAREGTALRMLLSSNGTQVRLVIDDFIVLAALVLRADLLEEEAFTLEEGGAFEVSLPVSVFDHLDSVGIELDGLVMVAMGIGEAVGNYVGGQNDSLLDGEAVEVQVGLSISLFDTEGAHFSVSNLAERIKMSMRVPQPALTECAVWDDELGSWSSEGLVKVEGSDGNFTCNSSHLSFFGGVVRGFVSAFACSQASLLTREGFEGMKQSNGWQWQLGTCLLYSLLLALLTLLLATIYLDVTRLRRQKWSDQHFLIVPSRPDNDEDAGRTLTWYAHVAAVSSAWLDACGSAARQFAEDVVDEIVTKISGHLSDVRQVCQAIGAAGAGMFSGNSAGAFSAMVLAMTHMATRAYARTAYLNTCAHLGVLPDDQPEEAIKEAGLHADASVGVSSVQLTCLHPQPPSAAQVSEGVEQPSRGGLGEDALQDSPSRSMKNFNMQRSRHLQQLQRDETLMQLHQSHTSVLDKEKERVHSFVHLLRSLVQQMLVHGPVGSLFLFSFYTPSSLRCLYFMCDVLGALAVTTLFMSVSGGARNRSSPSECTAGQDFSELAGRLIAVGLAAGVIAAFPVTVFSHFHSRKFVYVDRVGGKQWQQQLRKWFIMDVICWMLCLSYVTFCTIYVLLFFANVAPADHTAWLVAAITSFVNDFLLTPLAVFLVPILLVPFSVIFLRVATGKSFADVLRMLHEGKFAAVDGEGTTAAPEEKLAVEDLEVQADVPGVVQCSGVEKLVGADEDAPWECDVIVEMETESECSSLLGEVIIDGVISSI